MKSFKDYTPKTPSDGKNEKNGGANSVHLDHGMGISSGYKENADSTAADLTKRLAAAWNGKNSKEMLLEILAEAETGKRNGTLTNADIDAFYEQFAPLIDERQRRVLRGVIDRLKRI